MNEFLLLVLGSLLTLGVFWIKRRFSTKDRSKDQATEVKIAVMQSASRALAMYESDALNPERQARKQSDGRVHRITSMRDETTDALGETLATVQATFSKHTADLYGKAVRTHLSIETNPSVEYAANCQAALKAMADEIGLQPKR